MAFKGLFGEKFREDWRGTSEKSGLADKLGVLGLGISQLSAGQVPNILPAWQAVEDRRAKRKMGEAMGNPELLAGFTPEQQRMLAIMPPEMAQSLIAEKIFAPPPAPVKPEYREFGGDLYDMTNLGPDGKPLPVFDGMSEAEIASQEAEAAKVKRAADAELLGYQAGSPEHNYYMVTGEIPKPDTQSSAAEYGLQPVLGKDKDGNNIIMQLGKDGTAVITKIPEGVTPDIALGAYEKAQGAAEGKVAGETKGNAAATLPGVSGLAGLVADQVESLKTDPYLPNMLGPMDSRLPNISEDAARVQGKMDQIQGGAFLQARQLLKGGGAITDFEGKKAEAAFVRMNAAQSVEDFQAALDEFNQAVQEGVKKLEAQAAGSGSGAKATDMSDEEYLKAIGLE